MRSARLLATSTVLALLGVGTAVYGPTAAGADAQDSGFVPLASNPNYACAPFEVLGSHDPGSEDVSGREVCVHNDTARPLTTAARTLEQGRTAAGTEADENLEGRRFEFNGSWAAPRCDGDGRSGKRFQIVVASINGEPQGTLAREDIISDAAAAISGVFERSSGGQRAVRWTHEANCEPTVLRAGLPASAVRGADTFLGVVRFLRDSSPDYRRADRNYLVVVPHLANGLCGIGSLAEDDRKIAANSNNFGQGYALVAGTCAASPGAMAHEMTHNLGAVQASAPHATDFGHCFDGLDLVCYDDGSGQQQQVVCTTEALRLDCNDDDFFSVAPAPGSYLTRFFNTADNDFLIRSEPRAQATPTPPVRNLAATRVDATTVRLTWQAPTAPCPKVRKLFVTRRCQANGGIPITDIREYRVLRDGGYPALSTGSGSVPSAEAAQVVRLPGNVLSTTVTVQAGVESNWTVWSLNAGGFSLNNPIERA